MITDVDTHPRITGVIDWEFSGPTFATTLAQYPLFIVGTTTIRCANGTYGISSHSMNAFAKRSVHNICSNSVGGPPLSRLISDSYGIYLFQQMMQYPVTQSVFYPLFFVRVFGKDVDEDFPVEYYYNLMDHGILKKDTERF